MPSKSRKLPRLTIFHFLRSLRDEVNSIDRELFQLIQGYRHDSGVLHATDVPDREESLDLLRNWYIDHIGILVERRIDCMMILGAIEREDWESAARNCRRLRYHATRNLRCVLDPDADAECDGKELFVLKKFLEKYVRRLARVERACRNLIPT